MEFTLPLSIDGHASFFLEEDLVFNFTFAGKDALRQHTPSPSRTFCSFNTCFSRKDTPSPESSYSFSPAFNALRKGYFNSVFPWSELTFKQSIYDPFNFVKAYSVHYVSE